MEQWKDIEGYEGLYQISSYGRVKSLERNNDGKNQYGNCTMCLKEKILKPWNNGKRDSHLRIELRNNGKRETPLVHVLVAKAFIPNPHNYDIIHHIDHNPQNNVVKNLMWMSRKEHDKLHSKERGEKQEKRVYQYTLDGKLVAVWKSAREAARQLGFAQSHISSCCNGGFFDKSRNKWHKRETYKGFKWSYTPL